MERDRLPRSPVNAGFPSRECAGLSRSSRSTTWSFCDERTMTTGTSTISSRRIAIGALYEGMEVVQPTAEHPIRRCTALAASQVALSGDDLREKSDRKSKRL